MKHLGPKHHTLVLVCTNLRTDGRECCADKGGAELHTKLKEQLRSIDPMIRVSKSGCLDRCSEGATVVIMPQNIWLGGVTEADIPAITELITRADSSTTVDE
jgi:(2Fe-2S) ferredoxin